MHDANGKRATPTAPPRHDAEDDPFRLRLDSLIHKDPSPRFVYFVTLVASFGWFLVGYDTGAISSALLLLRQPMSLGLLWQQGIVAITLLVAAIFASFSAVASDKIGRKPTILAASALFTLGSVCMGVAVDKYVVLTGKFIVGSGLGLISVTVPVYLTECVPPHHRGRLVGIQSVMVSVGLVVSNVVAGLFGTERTDGWRYMLGLGAVPSFLHFLLFCFLPETPRWLLNSDKEPDARTSLQRLRGSDDIEDEMDVIASSCSQLALHGEDHSILYQIWQTSSARRALLVGSLLHLVQQFAGFGAIMYYSSIIIKMAGVQKDTYAIWLSSMSAFVYFLGTLLGLVLTVKMTRRALIISSLVGVTLCLSWLAAGFQFSIADTPVATFKHIGVKNSSCYTLRSCGSCIRDPVCGFCDYPSRTSGTTNGSCLTSDPTNPWRSEAGRCNVTGASTPPAWAYDFCPTSYSWIPLLAMIFFLALFAPGVGSIPRTVNAEIHPPWAKTTSTTVATVTNWVCCLVVAATFLTLVQAITLYGAFWLYAGLTLLGVVALGFWLPETKDRSGEEVQEILARPWCANNSKSDYNTKTIQYVHIRGLNRDGAISEVDSE